MWGTRRNESGVFERGVVIQQRELSQLGGHRGEQREEFGDRSREAGIMGRGAAKTGVLISLIFFIKKTCMALHEDCKIAVADTGCVG